MDDNYPSAVSRHTGLRDMSQTLLIVSFVGCWCDINAFNR